MNPSELRDLLLYAEKNEENYRKLPPGAGAVWLSRPDRSVLETGKRWLWFRLVLLGLTAFYFYFVARERSEVTGLLVVIACYEFAYYNAWKEKARSYLKIEI